MNREVQRGDRPSKQTQNKMAQLMYDEIDLLRRLEMFKEELELIPNSSILQLFREVDMDKDNQLGISDFQKFMESHGCEVTNDMIVAIIRRIETKDTFCTQTISLQEFANFVTSIKVHQ